MKTSCAIGDDRAQDRDGSLIQGTLFLDFEIGSAVQFLFGRDGVEGAGVGG